MNGARIAVVAGGWHWPSHFFSQMAKAKRAAVGHEVDLCVIGHRSPELRQVRQEKVNLNEIQGESPLHMLDAELYQDSPSIADLKYLGWEYLPQPNTVGDWGFLNQWLHLSTASHYDLIVFMHDDTYIRDVNLLRFLGDQCAMGRMSGEDVVPLITTNGRYPQAPEAYVRGSFEAFHPSLIKRLGGRFDIGQPTLTREGLSDSPAGMEALSSWNSITEPTRRYMVDNGLTSQVHYLSEFYRISKWAIEGERGLLSSREGADWSYQAGLKHFGVD